MSATEVVKKRGRPKKVVDPMDAELAADVLKPKKTTTRAKTTKVAKSTTTTAKAAPVVAEVADISKPATKPVLVKKTATKPAPKSAVASKATAQPLTSGTSNSSTTPSKPVVVANPLPPSKQATSTSAAKPAVSGTPVAEKPVVPDVKKTTVTPENSQILSKVRELPKNAFETPQPPAEIAQASKSSTGAKLTAQSSTTPPTAQPSASPKTAPSPPTPQKTSPKPAMAAKSPSISSPESAKPKSQPSKPIPTPSKTPPNSAPKPKIPVAALNSAIVSNISGRAGARPPPSEKPQLPPNYKPVARKVTMAIVAMPILIVTSYVLYERLILGEERKHLVAPGMSEIEPSVEMAKAEPPTKEA